MQYDKTKIKGLDIHYGIEDRGEYSIFFLHGWGGSKKSWLSLLERLNIDGSKIILDFPGFGESQKPKVAWNMSNYADFVEEFIETIIKKYALNKKIVLIVHSFGGRNAFKLFSKKRAFKVEKLVLIASAGIKHPDTFKKKLLKFFAKISKILKIIPGYTWIRKNIYKMINSRDYAKLEGVMKDTFLNVINEDLKPHISKINIPTMIFWGKHDSYVPLADAHEIKSLIPNASLKIFDDGKHGIHKTHAEDISEEIEKFIKA
ncbi:alpha/beta fold hydrolase [Candidatus Peregrinibacteria bacterium]|nr:alpha/beta fold hydrolase [Candidatus Peregrinibacteria bacterium]